MNEDVEGRVRLAGMNELIKNYRFERKFMELCEECDNYGSNWACPPFEFDVGEFLAQYNHAYLFAIKWAHSAETIAENNTVEKAAAYSRVLFRRGKEKMLELLWRLERKYAGSIGISAGGCSLCGHCSRRDKKPCRFSEKVRYSPESLGFDISKIAKEFLDIEILWGNDRLPKHQVLLNALFTVEAHDGIEREIREDII
jgi:predicted metal-binding protein